MVDKFKAGFCVVEDNEMRTDSREKKETYKIKPAVVCSQSWLCVFGEKKQNKTALIYLLSMLCKQEVVTEHAVQYKER